MPALAERAVALPCLRILAFSRSTALREERVHKAEGVKGLQA